MTLNYANLIAQPVPQTEPLPNQVKNSAGGYSYAVDDWTRLNRFLILGSEGGTYYVSEKKLTLDNAKCVTRCLNADGRRTVNVIAEVSSAGRAPKQEPAILALAMAASHKDDLTRKLALSVLATVCRTGTHLFTFLEYVQQFRGWGRGLKKAVENWYGNKTSDALAYQMLKYRQRNGWTHRDALRLAKPTKHSPAYQLLYKFATKPEGLGSDGWPSETPQLLIDFLGLQSAKSIKETVKALAANKSLTWEMVPTEALGHKEVWGALLPNMPLTAMVRNLGRMTANGLIQPLSDAERHVRESLSKQEWIRKSRVHPIAILAALTTYEQGKGVRGGLTWTPNQRILDSLNGAFRLAFGNVTPTNKRTLLALDVSGSMSCGDIAGVPGLTPRNGSAAMALVTAAVEPNHHIMGFSHQLIPLSISPAMRLDAAVKAISNIPFGGTDAAIPLTWALQQKVPVDTVVVYTDSESYAGPIHVSAALERYRQKMGIPTKLVVVGMTATEFSVGDPNDAGTMTVAGFDTSAPQVISDFSLGGL